MEWGVKCGRKHLKIKNEIHLNKNLSNKRQNFCKLGANFSVCNLKIFSDIANILLFSKQPTFNL
jgi:hypothetical protein